VLEEHREDLKRLFLQVNANTPLAELARPRVEVEHAKAGEAGGRRGLGHGSSVDDQLCFETGTLVRSSSSQFTMRLMCVITGGG
jgi:hypothetical protein